MDKSTTTNQGNALAGDATDMIINQVTAGSHHNQLGVIFVITLVTFKQLVVLDINRGTPTLQGPITCLMHNLIHMTLFSKGIPLLLSKQPEMDPK